MLKKILILSMFLPALCTGQWVQQGEDIYGAAGGDQAGYALSLSADGNTVAIGSRYNDSNGSASGHARVFENQDGSWVQKGEALTGDDVSDVFGSSISLSADGNILAVGAPDNNGDSFEVGNVKIFRFESDNWVQIGDEILGESLSDHSGAAISLSDDGNRVAIGAPNSGSNIGHVRVYENVDDEWVQLGDDIDGENENDYSGTSVSINEDGSIVAIGAPNNGDSGIASGHVRVFQEESGVWVQIGEDIDGGQDYYKAGSSVSINNQGNILAIGAIDNNNSGSARVYENQSNTWVQIGSDITGEGSNDDLGFSITINAEGNIFAVGSPFNDGGTLNAGQAKVYENVNNDWIQIGDDIYGVNVEDRSGTSISLSADGSKIATGAHLNDGNGTSSGHARIFSNSMVSSIRDTKLNASFSIYPNPGNGKFTIMPKTLNRVVSYKVIDMAGRISTSLDGRLNPKDDQGIENGVSGQEINVDLPSGVYLLRLELEDGSIESYRIGVVR